MTINEPSDIKDYFAGKVDLKRLACPHCNANKMRRHFMDRVNLARHYAKVAFVVNSGYRCLIYNKSLKSKKTSSHIKGLGMDVKCTDWWKTFMIIKGLYKAGIRRIRLYIVITKLGKIKPRHIHFDYDLTKPQDTFSVATYKKVA